MIDLQKSKPKFEVVWFDYIEPDYQPTSDNSFYNYEFRYEFNPPFEQFDIDISLYLIIREKKNDPQQYLQIHTNTFFKFPKEKWQKIGMLTKSGDLPKEWVALPEPMTSMIEIAFNLTQEAATYRFKDTRCEGDTMYKINHEILYKEVEERVLNSYGLNK